MKKIIFSLFTLTLLLPVTYSYAATTTTTDLEVDINAGILDMSTLPALNGFEFQSYTISEQNGSIKSTVPLSFTVDDFRGTWAGWGVDISMSDLNYVGAFGADKMSDNNASVVFDCSKITGSFACAANGTLNLTAAGTGSFLMVNAPASDLSTGRFNFTTALDFLTLNFDNTVKAGTYTGELLFEVKNTYTP
jgi:hypothetical protein